MLEETKHNSIVYDDHSPIVVILSVENDMSDIRQVYNSN